MPTIEHCLRCPYREHGPAIGSRGNEASRVVLVGEAPGATEVVEEEPFRGLAGRLLGEALTEAGVAESDVFIANAVACHPYDAARPRVRRPSTAAIEACHGRLARDLGAHPRTVIVTLGSTAVRAVTGQRRFSVTTKDADARLSSGWGTVVPTLHPAYVLRRGRRGPEWQTLVSDLKLASRLAAEGRSSESSA